MLNKLLIYFSAVFFIVSPLTALAIPVSGSVIQPAQEKAINEIFKKIGGNVQSIKLAPVKGLLEILIEKDGKTGIVFLDDSQKHLIQGTILDINSLNPVYAHNLEIFQGKQQTLDTAKIPANYSVLMGNIKGSKKLYVFTDPDCEFCRNMHLELKKLEKIAPDVAIHVMLFPLPMHPGAYDKARIIWETNNQEILDKAFEGKSVPKPTKENSKIAIDAIMKFAGENGIGGTPTLVLDNGRIIVGVKAAETLKIMLEEK